MTAVEHVQTVLDRLAPGSRAEVIGIGDGHEAVAVHLTSAFDLPALVAAANAELNGVGWTAYVRQTWERPPVNDVRAGMTNRQHFGQADVGVLWPDHVLRAADAMTDDDVEAQLSSLEHADDAFRSQDMEFEIDVQLASTRARYGTAPDRGEIPAAALASASALDRWLLRWELDTGGHPEPGQEFPTWQEAIGNDASLVAIPWARPEAVLATDLFHGADATLLVALSTRWHARYGARVLDHSGIGLAVRADRSPATPEEAYEVARAIDLVCNHLIGAGGAAEARRAYAHGLLHDQRWWLEGRL